MHDLAHTDQLPFGVVTDADIRVWLARHEAALKPYLDAAKPGGLTPRLCLEQARCAARRLDQGALALFDCIFHVLHAYRVADLIDRRGEADAWRQAQLRIAAQYDTAGDRERADALRSAAEQDFRQALAFEATERGVPAPAPHAAGRCATLSERR